MIREIIKTIIQPIKAVWSIFDDDAHKIISTRGSEVLEEQKTKIDIIHDVILSDSEIEIKQDQIWKHNKSGTETFVYDYHKKQKEVVLPTWGLMIVQENEFRDKFTFVSHSR